MRRRSCRLPVTCSAIATSSARRSPIAPAANPEELLKEFDVRSANYFEQLRDRAVRTINTTDLRQVTPDAKAKDRFVLIYPAQATTRKPAGSMMRKLSVTWSQ